MENVCTKNTDFLIVHWPKHSTKIVRKCVACAADADRVVLNECTTQL
jgi:hypothetical protein